MKSTDLMVIILMNLEKFTADFLSLQKQGCIESSGIIFNEVITDKVFVRLELAVA